MGVEDRRRAFGAQLRKAREAKGLSLRQLADQVPGLQFGTLGRVERGQHGIGEDKVRQIETLLDLAPGELGWLLGQAPPPNTPSPEEAIASDASLPEDVRVALLDNLAAYRRLIGKAE